VPHRLVLALLILIALAAAPAAAAGATTPLSISISGNSFVNGAGQKVRLLGVDRPGTEYACQQGWGYSSGPIDASNAAAIAAWNANAVRIPINEDCWLGINGQPSGGLSPAVYRSDIAAYVQALARAGIYAILDLHWSAPGTVVADGQRSMPDGHSTALWTSVANRFKTVHSVVFDLFNEPYSPAYDGYSAYPVSWSCWRNGGCNVPDARDGTAPVAGQTYKAVGMQQLVNAIRATSATAPILAGGLAYANDLTGWLANKPTDSAHQLAASVHVYNNNACASASCWNSQLAPVAAKVPLVTGEFDESDCSQNFDKSYMTWADAHGVGYLAWGWFVLTSQPCSALYLVTDYNGTPASPNGVAVQTHLKSLPALH
jgi:hypothetical protein